MPLQRHQRTVQSLDINAERQILVNLGNRYVVFGPPTGLPAKSVFRPDDLQVLPRVAAEADEAESRIVQTIRVTGLDRVEPAPSEFGWDIEFRDKKGQRLFVDIKTRDGPIRASDFERAFQRALEAQKEHREFETWFFNVDRLSLTIVGNPHSNRRDRWEVLEVWEKTKEGLFGRADVIASVQGWERALDSLYLFVRDTLQKDLSLEFDTSRTYNMSEELMRKFAVPDRELPILDVIRGGEVLASFVPRALWVIGSFGRVDLVTRAGTTLLVRLERGDRPNWQWVDPVDRRRTLPLDAQAVRDFVK